MSLSSLLKLATVTLALTLALVGTQGDAQAQRIRPAKAAKVVAPKAKLAGTAAFRPAKVSAALQSKLRGKLLMVAPRSKTAAYATAMKNSVEVLFMPNASSYGHLLVRVGDRMYDMPGPGGARKQRFTDAMSWVHSPAYGFVYARSAEQIDVLKREFEAFASAGHGFSMAGSGPTTFSCAGFVTSALRKHAPELEVGLSAGAISAAANILRAGKHDAVTLYGTAAEQAGNADFSFQKL